MIRSMENFSSFQIFSITVNHVTSSETVNLILDIADIDNIQNVNFRSDVFQETHDFFILKYS